MVRMIPPEPAAKTNRSERALFSAFEGILDRPDWVVIHSLAIGQHRAGLSGEIDFLVLVPGKGIVIIEAKSPAYVEYKAGRWHLDRTPSPSKDPLQQLDGARRSLRGLLKQAGVLKGDEPIARLVWFTSLGRYQFVNRTPGDLQFFEWELGWQEDLEKPAWLIEKVLDEHLAWFNEVDEVAIDPASMTAEHVAEISATLLADFTASRSKADDKRDRGAREVRLLAEQKFALELLNTNPHIYFEGPAGTGKSFLLVEAAVRFARDLRMPTLLTCWNVLMAEELRTLVRGRTQLIDIDDLNTVMLRLCGLPANPADADDTWYRETLPQRALAAVKEHPHLAAYQALCIDEFQDVASEPHVLELVLALTAALVAHTPVVLAGDDRQQILRGAGEEKSSVSIAREHLPGLVHARVRRNCRMLPSIADSVSKYLDPAFTFTGHRMPNTLPGGLTRVDVNETNDAAALATALRDLLADYEAEDIVVISPFGGHGSLAARILRGETKTPDETWLRKQLAHDGGAGQVRWYSISKFKGLDADAVIVTDINDTAKAWVETAGHSWDDFRYVAASRAKYRLILLDGLRSVPELAAK
ncbi:MAG: NERD domain-containing protein [Microbacteriaceae bacterium]|nr:NERD domain-containing protein [Microbacteriaceae bacterium]